MFLAKQIVKGNLLGGFIKIIFKQLLLLLIISLSFSSILSAQINNIEFSHLTIEDGLSMNAVNCLLQDNKGFIWIGTPNGLNRFDGYQFKVFTPNPNDSNSISDRTINCLAEDSQGNIWIGTSNGLNKYDWVNDKFYIYKNDPHNPNSLSDNLVLSILKDRAGNIWIGTVNGLNKYNPYTNNFTAIKKVSDKINPDSLNSVTEITEDYKGNLWLGTWNGISCIQKDGTLIKQLFPQTFAGPNHTYRFSSAIFEDKEKNLWIGTNGRGLYKYNQNTGKIISYVSSPNDPTSLTNNYISAIYQDKLGNIWIGTLYGLNIYNPKQDNFIRIYNNYLISSSLINNTIYSILQDRDGLLWFGTFRGISKFHESENQFFSLNQIDPRTGARLISDRVISVFIDKDNNIWDGTMDGVFEIKRKDNQIVSILNKPNVKNSLSSNFVRSVFVDHKGMVWIGTNDGGLNKYNPKTGNFKLYIYNRNDSTTISNNGVTSICEDNYGNLWLGTWFGLNKFDPVTEKFTRYFPSQTDSNSILNSYIWDVFKDSRGKIWVGTNGGGVSEIDPRTNIITNFTSQPNSEHFISDDKVYTIFQSKDGILWFGTINGLNSYNYKTGKTNIYTIKDGLPGNLIDAIQEDNKGNLWISTDKGLSKFNRKTGVFFNYGKRDGLNGLEFIQNVAAKSKDGLLYFGLNSLIYFNPDKIKDEYLKAPVVLTGLKIYNQPVEISQDGILRQSITTAKTIYVPYSKDVITLEFALLDYFDVKKNTFKYKLDGFDLEWNDIGNRNTATYTNLPPGEYTFYVKASNNNGIKNEKETSLRIIIIPEFYQTLWFKLASALGLLLMIIIVFNQRTRTINKRNKMLEAKVVERTRDLDRTIKELNNEIASKDKFYSIIAHDLRSPFTALLGFSSHLVEEIDDLTKEEIKMIADNVLRSARLTFSLLENLLDWARIKTGRINFEPQDINLKTVVNELKELYKWNFRDKEITLNIYVDDNITVYADLNMLETILRNLISNAIKFTNKKGVISIYSEDENKFVKIRIADNGVGISPEKIDKLFTLDKNNSSLGTRNEKGSGLGLILCKEFVELNNGKISVFSQPNQGTEFSFTLPKKENISKPLA